MRLLSKFKKNPIHKIAIPATIAGIAEPILSLTDSAMVGNIPGQGLLSLAAVGIVGSYLSMLIWVIGQSRAALSAIISQYLGAGKISEIKDLPAQAILINLGVSIVLVGISIAFMNPIFTLMNATGTLLEYTESYFSIRIWGFPLTLLTFAVFGVFRGLQNTYWPMVIALTGTLLNVLLDYVLVYGLPGVIAPMYLEGAAFASVIAQAIMAIMAFVLLYRKTSFRLRLQGKIHPELKRFAGMSFNLFIRTIALNAALIYSVKVATGIGPAYIGAHTIAFNLWLLAAFFIDGYSSAANLMGGKLLGAQKYNELWVLLKKTLSYALLVSGFIMFFGWIFYKPIGRLFSNDPQALEVFYQIFYIVILFMPLNAMAFVLDGLFKGLGEMKYLRNVLLLSSFIGFIPFVYVSTHLGYGLSGIWVGFGFWIFLPLICNESF